MTEQQSIDREFDYRAMKARAKYALITLAFLVAVAAFCATASAQTSGSGSLTIATEPVPAVPGEIITKLTWTTTPAGASCTASGDWTGAKAASGTETLPPVAPPRTYNLRCTWAGDSVATLTWTAPTQNTDGSPLAKCAAATDTGPCLAKYRILHGASATSLPDTRDHNFPLATTATWTGLTPGTHFFAIKTVNGQGIESAATATVSKTTASGSEWTASVGLKVPGVATGLAVQ